MNKWEVEVLVARLLELRVQSQATVDTHYITLLDLRLDLGGKRIAKASNRVVVFFNDTFRRGPQRGVDAGRRQGELGHSIFVNVSTLDVMHHANKCHVVD